MIPVSAFAAQVETEISSIMKKIFGGPNQKRFDHKNRAAMWPFLSQVNVPF